MARARRCWALRCASSTNFHFLLMKQPRRSLARLWFAMSISHASIPAERLATGWHVLGVMVSASICITALFAGWLLLCYPAAVMLPGMVSWLTALLFADALIGLCGFFWHLWATRQHLEALRLLRQPKDYPDSCR
jgi:hypothetical protein